MTEIGLSGCTRRLGAWADGFADQAMKRNSAQGTEWTSGREGQTLGIHWGLIALGEAPPAPCSLFDRSDRPRVGGAAPAAAPRPAGGTPAEPRAAPDPGGDLAIFYVLRLAAAPGGCAWR